VNVDQDGKPARRGYVFQAPRLLPWRTVLQNMMFVSDGPEGEAKQTALQYLEMVELADQGDMSQPSSPVACSNGWA